MVKLNRIYTRTGDDGTSGLVTGERRSKADARFEAIGAVDEVNAALGVARLHSADRADVDAVLARIQNDLFDLGADLATPEGAELKWEPLRILPSQVAWLEGEIDRLNEALPALKSFILPGGTPLGAHLHVARTIARRAEREVVAVRAAEGASVSATAGHYLNRLSDYLFVLSRHVNGGGAADVLWVPGQGR